MAHPEVVPDKMITIKMIKVKLDTMCRFAKCYVVYNLYVHKGHL